MSRENSRGSVGPSSSTTLSLLQDPWILDWILYLDYGPLRSFSGCHVDLIVIFVKTKQRNGLSSSPIAVVPIIDIVALTRLRVNLV